MSLQRRTRLHDLREPQVLFLPPSAHISSSKWPEIPAASMAPAHGACLIQNSDACWQLQTLLRHLSLRVQPGQVQETV